MLETIGVAKYSRYIAGRQYEEEDLDFNGARGDNCVVFAHFEILRPA